MTIFHFFSLKEIFFFFYILKKSKINLFDKKNLKNI
jgi:hypothetical protein